MKKIFILILMLLMFGVKGYARDITITIEDKYYPFLVKYFQAQDTNINTYLYRHLKNIARQRIYEEYYEVKNVPEDEKIIEIEKKRNTIVR